MSLEKKNLDGTHQIVSGAGGHTGGWVNTKRIHFCEPGQIDLCPSLVWRGVLPASKGNGDSDYE